MFFNFQGEILLVEIKEVKSDRFFVRNKCHIIPVA